MPIMLYIFCLYCADEGIVLDAGEMGGQEATAAGAEANDNSNPLIEARAALSRAIDHLQAGHLFCPVKKTIMLDCKNLRSLCKVQHVCTLYTTNQSSKPVAGDDGCIGNALCILWLPNRREKSVKAFNRLQRRSCRVGCFLQHTREAAGFQESIIQSEGDNEKFTNRLYSYTADACRLTARKILRPGQFLPNVTA